MENYYQILDLDQTASVEQIEKEINKQLRIANNSTNSPKLEKRQFAERMIKILHEAREILLNPSKRQEYDRKLQTTPTRERKVDEAEVAGSENLVDLGWKLLIDGNIPDALYVATQATKRDPENHETWALSGQAKFRWGEDEDAIADYKQAIKLLPNEASYYFDIGTIYESNERWGDALQQYQRAVQIDPSTTMYRAAVGVLLIKTENYDDGIKILQQCMQEEPDNSTYQWFMAIGYADSAYMGWTQVGENHPYAGPGWYATEHSHVINAQEKLNKAIALKFDDPSLKTELEQLKNDIDAMLQRKVTAAWFPPALLAFLGFIGIANGSDGMGAGFFAVIVAALYVISTLTPRYKINARTLKGKVYSEFAWLYDMFGGESLGCVGSIILYIVIFLLMPFVTVYNFIRNFAMK